MYYHIYPHSSGSGGAFRIPEDPAGSRLNRHTAWRSDDYSYFSNSMQLLSRFTRESFETLLDLSKQDPDKLENKAFLEQMNDTCERSIRILSCAGETS